ncbi:MAG: ABC transporter permease [Clostridia bacterium]|nr:ABC transporter permease [Clostridia bacterium]
MTKKSQNIISKISPAAAILFAVGVWWLVCGFGNIPAAMLPSPTAVAAAFVRDFPVLSAQAKTTLVEAFAGLAIGIALAFAIATLMDRFSPLYHALYPILVISQTIPTIAIAPLLVLWMGYELQPKIALVVLTTFFPITVSLLDGYKSVDPDAEALLRSMGAKRRQVFWYLKLPASLGQMFSGLKISASYAIVGAVIAEWLGGFHGLGVYMTKVKKAYAFDKMFAVILLIILISLLLMLAVSLAERFLMPWQKAEKEKFSNQ